jgi:NADPH:quinone reductase-like Zn-dependent oxidoreductase
MTIPETMKGVQLTGNGGLDKLVVTNDIPVPEPLPGEVLIRVGACGMNNTDINTRTGWYSKSVTAETGDGGSAGFTEAGSEDSTWGGSGLSFPRIQGADVAGHIAAVGPGVDGARVGERVLVDPWMRDPGDPDDRSRTGYFGSERDGGFAEYTTAPSINAFKIDSTMSDSELATFPCSYSTGEYMLTRARLCAGETVLITGASGGVGSGLVQLARTRGARVIAIAGKDKLSTITALGADAVISRSESDLASAVRDVAIGGAVNVVADVVGGDNFPILLDLLTRGGRYVTSGAIAGPIVNLDLRTLYLKDLELWGATVMPRGIFQNLVKLIELEKIRPLLARAFALEDIHSAQTEFLEKRHVGNFVIKIG